MFCVALFYPHTKNRNTGNAIYKEKLPAMSVDSFFLVHKLIPMYDLHIKYLA